MNFYTLTLFLFLNKSLYFCKNIKINNIKQHSSYYFNMNNIENNIKNNNIENNNIENNNIEYNKFIIKNDNEYNNINEIKNSSFYLPGLFEVFPEFKIDFTKYKFKLKTCVKDDDCDKPEMCCDNPLKENDKFCCNGAVSVRRTPSYAF